MAGQAEFEAPAERGAVDRRDKRLAAGFNLAPKLLQLTAAAHVDLGVALPEQNREVGTGHEVVLA